MALQEAALQEAATGSCYRKLRGGAATGSCTAALLR